MPDDTTPPDHTPAPADTGTSLTPEQASQAARLQATLAGPLPPEQALAFLLEDDPQTWWKPEGLAILAGFRDDPIIWASIVTHANRRFVKTAILEAAVDTYITETAPSSAAATPGPARFTTISARDLYAKDLPDLPFIIAEILPVGGTLLTARTKDGKSRMAWNLVIAVASNGLALGRYPVRQGPVLYLALEDGERRAKKRLTEQMSEMGMAEVPDNLEFVFWEAPRLGNGFEASLNTWLDEHSKSALVVVDILEKVRPGRTKNGSGYADDYKALESLQQIALTREVAILVLHHSNKTNPEDFRDTASGTTGLLGAVDTFWSLKRVAGHADALLRIIGRDVEEQELAMRFERGFWTVLGDAEEYRLSKTSRAILEALQASSKPLTPKQLAGLVDIKEGTLRLQLRRMDDRGEVLNTGDGRYIPRTHSTSTHERERRRESENGVTPVTGVTGVTPVTGVTHDESYRVTGVQELHELQPGAGIGVAGAKAFKRPVTGVTGVPGEKPSTGYMASANKDALSSQPHVVRLTHNMSDMSELVHMSERPAPNAPNAPGPHITTPLSSQPRGESGESGESGEHEERRAASVPSVPAVPLDVPTPGPDACPGRPQQSHEWTPLATTDFCPWCQQDRPRETPRVPGKEPRDDPRGTC